jgi:hypothetical protein
MKAAPSKSGETRKKNNAFRRYIVAMEERIREEKIASLSDDKQGEIVGELEEILDHYADSMEAAEEPILEECNEMMEAVISKFGWEETEAMADSYGFRRGHFGSVDENDLRNAKQESDRTHLDDAKHMPMAELKEKYNGFLPEFEESYADTQKTVAILKARNAKVTVHTTNDGEACKPLIAKVDAEIAEEAEPQQCGVCQRPWIDGKCSGGFVNHKL